MISPRAASGDLFPTFEGGLEVTGEAVILADLETRPLVRVVILVPSLCNIGDIALPVYELGRALNTEAALDLPVDRGDVAAQLVGDPLFRPSIFEARLDNKALSPCQVLIVFSHFQTLPTNQSPAAVM